MHITRAADYAFRVMIHLASLPRVTVRRPDLAKALGVPQSFLSKVLQQLVQAGVIISHRGFGGGFQLAVARNKVSLLDVLEAIEGDRRPHG
jgi:Rrf2 family transcriptional regulator, iron-sulfur cluster assembly transcription factor